MKRIIGLLLTVAAIMVATVVFSGVAFGAANERASCLGVQRSNAEEGDVGRFSRELAGEEFFGHSGQREFAIQGEQPGRTTVVGTLETEGSGPPGKPSESLAYSVTCETTTE